MEPQCSNNQENPNPDHDSISKANEIQENEAKILAPNKEEEEEEEDEEEEEGKEDDDNEELGDLGFEFSFMVDEANPSSPISAEEVFANGQIKPVHQFNGQDLLMMNSLVISSRNKMKLPTKPPVKNVYVELADNNGHATTTEEDVDGDVYAVTSSPTPSCKKSNSTGFSRIWRFSRGFAMGRSHSDGRDAFVFLNEGHAPPSNVGGGGGKNNLSEAEESKSSTVKDKGKDKKLKKKEEESNTTTSVKGKGKGKKVNISACEAYMRSKADEKRRSTYLPYRPGLMGFFTSTSGGMSKNVHPF